MPDNRPYLTVSFSDLEMLFEEKTTTINNVARRQARLGRKVNNLYLMLLFYAMHEYFKAHPEKKEQITNKVKSVLNIESPSKPKKFTSLG